MYTKYCLTQGWDVTKMSNVTMMELSKELDEQFDRLLNECMVSGEIDQELYTEYDVKRGLRDANGKGVLTGLTEISDVLSYKSVDGKKMPADGELYFQGYNVKDLIAGFEVCQHRNSLEALSVLSRVFRSCPDSSFGMWL